MAAVDWEKHVDEASGSAFYYNTQTGESSWDVPRDAQTVQQSIASERNERTTTWRAFVDDGSGATYYYDEVRGVSRWDKPKGDFLLDKREVENERNELDTTQEGYGQEEEQHHEEEEEEEELVASEEELQVESKGTREQEEQEKKEQTETEIGKKEQEAKTEKEVKETKEAEKEEEKEEEGGRDGRRLSPSGDAAGGTVEEAERVGEDGSSAAHPWVKYVDAASDKPYYFNRRTGKTQWEQPEGFEEIPQAASVSTDPHVSAEYQAHLNRMRTERLARVTQQVLDPSGHLSKLNSILSSIDSKAPPTAGCMDGESADAPRTAKAEWQQHVDAQTQRYYYHNIVTGVTQWNKPDASIVSGLASWIPPKLPDPESTVAGRKTVPGVNYAARAKFNRLTGKYEQLGGDEYWQNAGIAADRAGRQMSHFFDMSELEKNREEARRRKEQLKRKNIDWKKISAEKKAKKQKQRNEWLFAD